MRSVVKSIDKFLYSITGQCYISEELLNVKEDLILHISDTPSIIFSSIIRLINELKPRIIIHTGDLVDNIKLELYPSMLPDYEKSLKPFLSALEKTEADELFIVPGNHDSLSFLKDNIKTAHIVPEGTVISFNSKTLGFAHKIENLPNSANYNFYGHNSDTFSNNDRVYLNGISNINIISMCTWKIYNILYPIGTNEARKIGMTFKTL